MNKIPLSRAWVLCGLLFFATALSFLDRQVLSVLAPKLISEFGMTNTAYSRVVFAFVLSYTVMFSLGGRLMDVLGTRLGLMLSVGCLVGRQCGSCVRQRTVEPGRCAFVSRRWRRRMFSGSNEGRSRVDASGKACSGRRLRERRLGLWRSARSAAHGMVGRHVRVARRIHRHGGDRPYLARRLATCVSRTST